MPFHVRSKNGGFWRFSKNVYYGKKNRALRAKQKNAYVGIKTCQNGSNARAARDFFIFRTKRLKNTMFLVPNANYFEG